MPAPTPVIDAPATLPTPAPNHHVPDYNLFLATSVPKVSLDFNSISRQYCIYKLYSVKYYKMTLYFIIVRRC